MKDFFTATPLRKETFSIYVSGLIAIIISLSIYIFGNEADNRDIISGISIINYLFSVIYFFVAISISGLRIARIKASDHRIWINLVVLLTISAFSLNKDMNVFAKFPTWLNIYTVSTVLILLLIPYIEQMPNILRRLVYFLAGVGFLLSIYMTIFLIPYMVLGIFVIWFLGISIHAFVPLFWGIIFAKLLFTPPSVTAIRRYFLVGFSIPLLFLGYYFFQWTQIHKTISAAKSTYFLKQKEEFPQWFAIAQKIKNNTITEQILMAQLKSQNWRFNDFGFRGMRDKYHNPLAIIGSALIGDLNLDESTVLKLNQVLYKQRHETARRLWNGSNLLTNSISTDIQVFPEYRIAYIEKTLSINYNEQLTKNNDFRWIRNNTQEAIYTFHLPEGTVVTSLSLWINGKEEKSRLSTRQRADSAYNQIVGVQRRDPALLHWQEGNRVTVNVFPCSVAEDRVFKIGFTQPMKCENGRISLENIWWEGPPPQYSNVVAQEAMRVRCLNKDAKFLNTQHLKEQLDGSFEYQGKYKNDWKIELAEMPLSSKKFSFGGKKFHIETENEPQQVAFTPKEIVLDITDTWTKNEYDRVLALQKNANLYVFAPEKIEVNNKNADKIWSLLRGNRLSLFPFHALNKVEETLIITKGNENYLLLADLDGSNYAKKIEKFFNQNKQTCRVLDIGEESIDFYKSLNELKVIELVKGDLSWVEKNVFPTYNKNTSIISLPNSKMQIIKDTVANISDSLQMQAPDHLMRLFVYNDLMRKIGGKFFERSKYEQKFLREAEEAYILSPVTSLVVLETQADYKRFGINENMDTLGNAKISGGEVPEPHEWLLIALSIAVFAGLFYRKNQLF